MTGNKLTIRYACRTLGLAVCIIPPVIAILSYFPLWRCGGRGQVLSGGAVLLLAIAHAPLIKWLKLRLESPASYTVWLALFIAFMIIASIAEQMKVISLVGFISNLAGALIMKLSSRIGGCENERDEGA